MLGRGICAKYLSITIKFIFFANKANNDLQKPTQKTKDQSTRTLLKAIGVLISHPHM